MPIPWLQLSRYALLVALCELIPVPLLDGFVSNRLRRRLTRRQAAARGIQLTSAQVRQLADPPGGGCLKMLWDLLVWPFQRLLRVLLFVLLVNRMVNLFSDVVHRALLVHEALEMDRLPHDTEAVRAAMRQALDEVDTKVVDRALFDVLGRSRRELWRILRSVWPTARAEARAEARAGQHEGMSPITPLSERAESMSRALADAVRVPGVQAELVIAFRRALEEQDGTGQEARPSV